MAMGDPGKGRKPCASRPPPDGLRPPTSPLQGEEGLGAFNCADEWLASIISPSIYATPGPSGLLALPRMIPEKRLPVFRKDHAP
jgi:hypothetical protein